MNTENKDTQEPQIQGANSIDVARKQIEQNIKKQFQQQRQDIVKKLEDALKTVEGIKQDMRDLDQKEADTLASYKQTADFLLKS